LLNPAIADPFQAQFCGGTVVAARWVVTAYHCVDGLSPAHVQVALNVANLSAVTPDKRIPVVAIRRYPVVWPTANSLWGDLAMLQIDRDAGVTPMPLVLAGGLSSDTYAGTPASIAGWGRLSEGGPFPDALQEATVSVGTDSACRSLMTAGPYYAYNEGSEVCAGYVNGGVDSCSGDSGGPLAVGPPSARVLLGVTAWGIGCARPFYPGVYVDLTSAAFRDWICTWAQSPVDLRVTSVTETTAVIEWTPPPCTSYTSWSVTTAPYSKLTAVTPGVGRQTITGLTAGTAYTAELYHGFGWDGASLLKKTQSVAITTSSPPPPPPPPARVVVRATATPHVTGRVRVGAVLQCVGSAFSGDAPSGGGYVLTTQWRRNGATVKTGRVYRVTAKDKGKRISCAVIGRGASTTATATSSARKVPR